MSLMRSMNLVFRAVLILTLTIFVISCYPIAKTGDDDASTVIVDATEAPTAESESMSTVELGDHWAIGIGGDYSDHTSKIINTEDDGLLVVGWTKSGGIGETDGFVLKLDKDGALQWVKAYGGSNDDFFRSAVQQSDGSFIVAGETKSFGDAKGDAWLLKLDRHGNPIWQKVISSPANEYINSIEVSTDNEIYLTGTAEIDEERWQDIWAAKLNIEGQVVWQKLYSTTITEYGRIVKRTHDDSIVLAGWAANRGTYNIYMMDLDKLTGDVQWSNMYTLRGNQTLTDLIHSVDGDFLFVGNSFVPGTGRSGIIFKTSRNGDLDWAKVIGSPDGADYIYEVAQIDDGFILSGESDSISNGGTDAWLLRVDEEGNVIRQIRFGDKDHDGFVSVLATEQHIFAGGYTFSFRSFARDLILFKTDLEMDISTCSYCGVTFATSTSTDEIVVSPWDSFSVNDLDVEIREISGAVKDISRDFYHRLLFP
jgi:hypothetical protein